MFVDDWPQACTDGAGRERDVSARAVQDALPESIYLGMGTSPSRRPASSYLVSFTVQLPACRSLRSGLSGWWLVVPQLCSRGNRRILPGSFCWPSILRSVTAIRLWRSWIALVKASGPMTVRRRAALATAPLLCPAILPAGASLFLRRPRAAVPLQALRNRMPARPDRVAACRVGTPITS